MSNAAFDGVTLVLGGSAPATAHQSPAGLFDFWKKKIGESDVLF